MKKQITVIALLMGISIYGKTQCIVNINPQSSTTFCQGDSVTLAASASATVTATLDQSNTGSTSVFSYVGGTSIWQSFTAGITGTLTKIAIYLAKNSSNTPVGTLNVYQGIGTSGPLLDSKTIVVNTVANFIYTTVNAPVTTGMQYTFETIFTGASNDVKLYLESPTGFYPGGSYLGTSKDVIFATYVEQTKVISYYWSNSSTDSTIVVNSSGSYSVTITVSPGGCTSSDSLSITVNPLPPIPTVTANMSTLASSSSSGNQWYLNGNPISAATSQFYNVTQNGFYTVCVTDVNGCSSCSVPYNFSTIGIQESQFIQDINIFPNPNPGKFNIQIEGKWKTQDAIEIHNMLGESVFSTINVNRPTPNEIDLSSQPNGIYFIQIKSEKESFAQKIIIQK